MQPTCLTVQIHSAFASKDKSSLGRRARVLEGLKSTRSLEFFVSNICSLNCKFFFFFFVFKVKLSFSGVATFLGG